MAAAAPVQLKPIVPSGKISSSRDVALPKAAPFIKWVGGKGRLLTQLRPLLPPAVDKLRHVEPFVGGGAVFFGQAPKRALLCDINATLIDTYVSIRDQVDEVIQELSQLAKQHDEQSYYRIRAEYNHGASLSSAKRSAMFIYLNKTCFNGLYRVNRKGLFNVPKGRYLNPRILDESTLQAASHALQKAELRRAGFESLLSWARPGDFVYFDPPYEPISKTANFTSYAEGGFGREAQARLADVFRELSRRKCKLMLSNSDTPLIRELYQGFQIDIVAAPRAISCKGNGRQRVTEVVVRNYI